MEIINSKKKPIYSKAFRFISNAFMSLALNYAVTITLHEGMNVKEQHSYAFALVVVFFFNFFMCRHFVYKASGGCVKKQMTGYLFSSIFFRLVEFMLFGVMNGYFGIWYVYSIFIVQSASFVVKFFWYNKMFTKQGVVNE